MGQTVKMKKNEAALRSFLWSVILGLLVVIAYLVFAYQRPGMVRTALEPVIDKVDSMMSKLPAMPSVMLTEPTTVLFMGVDVSYSGARRHLKIDKTSLKGNSDTMMLGFLNPPQRKASILHIPRDTEAYVGNLGIQKINTANCVGGPELARSSVSNLLSVPVQHYLVLNLAGFVEMVNELGGITVEVQKKMSYMDWTAKLKIDLEPGVHTLTGNQAMGFVRFRHDALGDIGRVQRQQIFMQAVARKMADPRSWVHVPALLQIAQNNIETDMNQMDLIAVINYVHSLPKENIKFVMLPGQFSPNGDWIATSDGRILAQQLANPDQEYVSSRRNITVCVVNASSDRNFGGKVAQALRKLGYVTSVAQDDPDPIHKKTQIIAQNGNTANAKMLQQDLGRVGDVINASVGSLIGSITIIAHDDVNLDKINLSSTDAPYVAQVAMPPPIVSKPLDAGNGAARHNPSPADADLTRPASNGHEVAPDGTHSTAGQGTAAQDEHSDMAPASQNQEESPLRSNGESPLPAPEPGPGGAPEPGKHSAPEPGHHEAPPPRAETPEAAQPSTEEILK